MLLIMITINYFPYVHFFIFEQSDIKRTVSTIKIIKQINISNVKWPSSNVLYLHIQNPLVIALRIINIIQSLNKYKIYIQNLFQHVMFFIFFFFTLFLESHQFKLAQHFKHSLSQNFTNCPQVVHLYFFLFRKIPASQYQINHITTYSDIHKIHINIGNLPFKIATIPENIRKRNNADEKVEIIFHNFHGLFFPNLFRNQSQDIKQRNIIPKITIAFVVDMNIYKTRCIW